MKARVLMAYSLGLLSLSIYADKGCDIPKDSHGLKHGKEVCYHPNGKVKYEINWRNGKQNGKSLVFEPSGNLLIEQNFSNGVPDGLQKDYSSSQNKLTETKNYAKGRRVGTWKAFFTDGVASGKVKTIKTYDDDNLKTEEEFYPNGKTRFLVKHGELGPVSSEHYDEKGNLQRQWQFDEKSMVSETKTFANGKLKKIENKKGDAYHGMVVEYLENGKEKSVFCFQEGVQMQGTYACEPKRKEAAEVVKIFYENGKERVRYTLENGKKEGESTEYYPSGTLKEVQIYKNDKLNGIVKSYHPSGELARETEYARGKKNGEEKTYYLHTTNPQKVIVWNNDKKEKETDFYPDQKIASEKTWDNRSATLKNYSEKGVLREEIEYKVSDSENGQIEYKHGSYKKYYDDGKKYSVQNFIEGKEDGLSVTYFSNGNVKKKAFFELGNEIASVSYRGNGEKLSQEGDINRLPASEDEKKEPQSEAPIKIIPE